MIVYNTTSKPIFIVVAWEPSVGGGPAIQKTTICVGPEQGVDLACYGLKTKKEMVKK